MNRNYSRRFILAGFGALMTSGAALANAPKVSLRPHMRGVAGVAAGAGKSGAGKSAAGQSAKRAVAGVDTLIANSGLQGQVVCAVADVKTGLHLEAVKGNTGLPPASVAKALTALYALDALGAEYRFKTRLIAGGPVKNGVLKGDLILSGGGDPTLATDHLAAMARKLKAAGIREVRGTFKVYDGALPYVRSIDGDQPDHLGYSPSVSGIALNFNRVHFEWKRKSKGYVVSMDARSDKYRPEVAMARMRVVNRNVPIYTYGDKNGVDQWTVASKALGKGGSRWLPVRKPALYAGEVFRTFARSNGITMGKPKVTRSAGRGGKVVVSHTSTSLRTILKGMLKYSNNLTAEMVGMTASTVKGGKPKSLKGSANEMNRWAAQKFGMRGVRMVDHSGLNDDSRMTAKDLVGALVQVRKRGILRPLLKPIAMRDARGRVVKNHPIRVDAKTGTLNFVSGLAGYMTAADGTELAFAIFAADTDMRARIKRADREGPNGARGWNKKAKRLQQNLIERWGALYGS